MFTKGRFSRFYQALLLIACFLHVFTHVGHAIGPMKYNVSTIVKKNLKCGYGYPLPKVGINSPNVVIHTLGGIYYYESLDPSIRFMKNYNESVEIIAGTGVSGYSGDGGLATKAAIGAVTSIRFHPHTNELYFADETYNVIRKIDVNGTIWTYCGKSNQNSQQAGLASQSCTAGYFKSLKGMKFDMEGNLYVVSKDQHVIYKIDVNGTTASVFAGKLGLTTSFAENVLPTESTLNQPTDLYIDTNGDMYIADTGNHIIRLVNASNGNITTFAGTKGQAGGSINGAVVSKLNSPTSVLMNKDKTYLYVSDNGSWRIKKINMSDKKMLIVVGGGGSDPAHGVVISGTSLVMNSGVRFITENANEGETLTFGFGNYIRRLLDDGKLISYGGSQYFDSEGVHKSMASFLNLFGFATNSTQEEIVVSDGNRILKIGSDGFVSRIAGSRTSGNGYDMLATSAKLSGVQKIVRMKNGDIMFSDNSNNMLKSLTQDGYIKLVAGVISDFKGSEGYIASSSLLSNPNGLFENSKGELLIADTDNHRIRKIDTNGIINTILGVSGVSGYLDGSEPLKAKLNRPISVIEIDGNIYVSDKDNQRIRKMDASGVVTSFAGGGFDDQYTGNDPTQLRIERIHGLAAFNNYLYFSDRDAKVVRRISLSTGTVSIYAGCKNDPTCENNSNEVDLATSLPLNTPESIAILSNGDLLIAEYESSVIRRVNASDGKMYTFTGKKYNNQYNSNDDNKSASLATISYPKGLTVDQNTGDIYLAEQQALRKISADGIISSVFSYISPTAIAFNPITKDLFYSEASFLYKYSNSTRTLVIGNGGDMAHANQTVLKSPSKFVVNNDNEVFLIDKDNHKIRKIDKNGIVNRYAGIGESGYSGDGFSASNAKLTSPVDISISPEGDLYILEDDSNTFRRIRKVFANGTITTFAGKQGFESDYGKVSDLGIGNDVKSLAYFNNSIYFSTSQKIKRIDQSGNIYTIAGKQNGVTIDGPGLDIKIESANLELLENGDLLFSEAASGTIKMLTPYCPDGASKLDDFKCLYSCNGSTDSTGCMSRGECIGTDTCYCDPGYTGQFCQEIMCNFKKSTDPSVCNGKGSCVGANNCTCQTGYTGSNCERKYCFGILNTDNTVCSQHGSCQEYNTCNCYYGYSQPDCSVYTCNSIHFNTSNVCGGNGACKSYDYCECNAGYSGQFCQSFSCFGEQSDQPQACSSRGTCSKIDTCTCEEGYFGNKCQYTTCFNIPNNSSDVCMGRGSCDSYNGCQCTSPFFGEDCSLYNCYNVVKNSSDVCSGHGACVQVDTCKCTEGYYGENCQSYNCSGIANDNSTVCSSRGQCSSPNNCTCEIGYTGENCEIPVCFNIISTNGTVCSGHGQCISANNCTCAENYYGEDCSSYDCFSIVNTNQTVCSGHGDCASPNNCTCKNGYFGSDCENHNCYGLRFDQQTVCSSRGQCSSPNNCTCKAGYTGFNCNSTTCFAIDSLDETVCAGFGSCDSFNNCTCTSGYYGDDCSSYNCFGILKSNKTACYGSGICVKPDLCECKPGYSGKECQFYECSGISYDNSTVCSSRGQCSSPNNCTCEVGYTGTNCQFTTCYGVSSSGPMACSGFGSCDSFNNCTCATGYFENDCHAYTCSGVLYNQSNVCSGGGSCIGFNTCNCSTGYYGNNCESFSCFGKLKNDSSVCSGRGQCSSPNNCTCEAGYNGTNCQFTTCYGVSSSGPMACSGFGTCDSFNNCTCKTGHFENDCHAYTCSGVLYNQSNVCSGKGVCSEFNNCNCSTGYFGSACETFGCNGFIHNDAQVCSSRGSCESPNVCSCQNGYFGENCQFTTCNNVNSTNPTVCSTHGSCSSFNNCTCLNGYFGDECNLYTCSGLLFNDTNICSGKGACTAYNQCKCSTGYYGNNCETFGCFGQIHNDDKVCSSRGTCTKPNVCSCQNGYFGENCQFTTCNNVNSTNPMTCSGFGTCDSFNNCTCATGYFENDCHAYTCSGVLYNQSNVCSGGGSCIGFNTCNCSTGYYGNNCESYSCFGKLKNDSSVCSGRGQCIAKDTCSCKSTSTLVKVDGSECEKLYCIDQDNKYISASSSKVCSSRGQCTDSGCSCSGGYFGNLCQNFTCFGIESTGQVCGGHGSCVDKDTCVCKENAVDGYWGGSECSSCLPSHDGSDCKHKICDTVTTCHFPKGSCNASLQCVCSGNFDGRFCDLCKPNYYGSNCDKYCEKSTTCSSHGECSLDGLSCQCYNDSIKGYWSDKSCSSCQSGYYGNECSTRVLSDLRFSDSGSGIEFSMSGPSTYTKLTVPCTSLLHPSDISILGNGVKCSWINKKISIVFGGDYSITPYTNIRLNMRTFDSASITTEYLTFEVLPPLNPIKPIATITTQRTQFGSCEEISIDGSSSYSGDRKSLSFNWTITPSIPNLENSVILSQPILVLPESISSGSYRAELIVKSTFTLSQSIPAQLSFVKLEKSLPIVTIVGPSQITTVTDKVPIYVKTLLTLPSCFPNTTTLSYQWTLLEGSLNDVEFTQLENGGMVITNFKEKSEKSYLFSVTVSSNQDTSVKTSAQIRINALERPFSFIVYTSELTVSSVKVAAELTTSGVDYNSYAWNWDCYDSENQASCDSNTNSILASQSTTRSISFTLPKPTGSSNSYDISLKIKQNIYSVRVNFPVSVELVPPVINLLSVSPLSTSISSKAVLNLQFSVSIQDKEEGISSEIERSWLLNGIPVDPSLTIRMTNSLSLSNSIILDMSKLDAGESYALTFAVKGLKSKLSTSYIYNFNIVAPPQPCTCSLSPSKGTALDTVFTIKCPNCLASSSMSLTLGYIDGKTGSKIKLFTSGSEFTTPLPLTSGNNLKLFTIVSDSNSNTEAEQEMSVNIVAPTVPLSGVLAKQKAWQKYANSLALNDPRKIVFSSSNINYLVTVLIKATSNMRNILTNECKNGGELNTESNICKCATGFKKIDCSMTQSIWEMASNSRTSLMEFFLSDLDSRIQYEPVDEQFLTYSALGFETFLSAFDELGELEVQDKLISDSFTVFRKLVTKLVENKNLAVPTGVDLLMKNILNGYYQYQVWKSASFNSTTSVDPTILEKLQQVTVDFSSILLRSYLLGEEPLTISTDFSNVAVRQVYPIDMANLVMNYEQTKKAIVLPSQMIQNIQNVNSRKLVNIMMSSFINHNLVSRNETETNRALITVKSANSVEFKTSGQELKPLLSNNIEYIINHSNSNNTASEKLISSTMLDPLYQKNIYQSSNISCVTIENSILTRDSQCSIKEISLSTVTCSCSKQARVMIIEEIKERISITHIPPNEEWGVVENGLGYYAFFTFLGVAVVIAIAAVVGVSVYCVIRKKKLNHAQEIEMKQV